MARVFPHQEISSGYASLRLGQGQATGTWRAKVIRTRCLIWLMSWLPAGTHCAISVASLLQLLFERLQIVWVKPLLALCDVGLYKAGCVA